MGKPKTQRTEALHKAARRYVVGKQVEKAIEQHNFDRLIEQGLVVEDRTSSIKPVEITTRRLINWRDETLLVNAKPGTGDKQLKDYYKSMLKKDEGYIGASHPSVDY